MNNKYPTVSLVTLLFFFVTLMSCQSNKTPSQVSEHFWLGMQTKNIALVKKYSLVSSVDESEDLAGFGKVSKYSFGRIIIDGDVAEVETKVLISSDNKNKEITLNTYLENHNDVWKVNFKKTVLQLVVKQSMEEVFNDIDKMTEEITGQIQESVEQMKEKVVPEMKSKADEIQEKVVPEVQSKIEEVEKEMMKKLPELKSMLDEFLNELGKSLEELMPAEKKVEPKTQET